MIQRKKSMRHAYADKMRQKPPQEWPGRKSAVLSRKGAQDGAQAARKPRAGLKRVSSKRAKENRQYTSQRKAFLLVNPFCQIRTAHCTHHATDIHHRAGRLGAMLLDESEWLSACRNCHDWCHQHSNAARELGFIAPRGT